MTEAQAAELIAIAHKILILVAFWAFFNVTRSLFQK